MTFLMILGLFGLGLGGGPTPYVGLSGLGGGGERGAPSSLSVSMPSSAEEGYNTGGWPVRPVGCVEVVVPRVPWWTSPSSSSVESRSVCRSGASVGGGERGRGGGDGGGR